MSATDRPVLDVTDLPIYDHRDELVEALTHHRVVVVEGPTGCGKTTQLPRILLQAGFGRLGMIGVTQPRRIAAVSVAWRVAQEESTELGDRVGYAIRFDDRTSHATELKVMTDGLLLQEVRTDPDFSAYGVIIVDEAHERSLNIDFTLGLLHRALQRRDDLRVIISSATMNPRAFQDYFGKTVGDVPLVSIQARKHPVDIRYDAMHEDDGETHEAAATHICRFHRKHPVVHGVEEPGHVLVFMPGEAAIRSTVDAVHARLRGRDDLELLPLYGRLPREEQERIFEPFPGKRKVVIATNIAETSITIPNVRFVVDSGLAKVPRVSTVTGITTLREEGISRASADQRAGRAGRTAPGTAVRLYTKKDLRSRPEFTDEEVLRLDFTEVALRLINLGIHDIEAFAFPTPPPRKKIKAAINRLKSMGAIDDARHLTSIGRRMVLFPLSPPQARMIVEAADHHTEAVDDVIIASALLSNRSPWLFPAGEENEARAAQRRMAHPLGDVVTGVMTYRAWQRSKDKESFCRRNYLEPQTMAFIRKAHEQMRDIAQHNGIEARRGADPTSIVRCLATGFADRILMARGRSYEGPGDVPIAIHPSSVLYGGKHRFVAAAELVISRRPYAMSLSIVDPAWIPQINPELASRWRIRTKRSETKERIQPPPTPSTVSVGSVTLPVNVIKGQPRLELPVSELDALIKQPTIQPPAAAQYKARIWTGRYRMMAGTPLGYLIDLLPLMPLPAHKAFLQRDPILGALLETERNLHAIERRLARLLTPLLPERGKQAGWMVLNSNGGGGFWFEVMSDFGDAVLVTQDGLRDLYRDVNDDDPLHAELEARVDWIESLAGQIETAKANMRGARRRSRRRR